MAKKIRHVPSDFSKPKPGVLLKKDEAKKPKPRLSKLTLKAKAEGKPHKPKKEEDAFKPKTGRDSFKPKSDGASAQPKTKRDFVKPKTEGAPAKPKSNRDPYKRKTEHLSFQVKLEEKISLPKTKLDKNSKAPTPPISSHMPLNKYVAHCGICSRREAAELIKKGKVKVNSLVQTEPGTKVNEQDYIVYEGQRIFPKKNFVYYLLNKPKNTITTTDDPEGRKVVMDLLTGAPEQNVYPVGRLDRNTTGLLLLTNDGDLAQKLTHPKYNIKKIYQVTLDKPLSNEDFDLIIQGIMLEDGKAVVDDLAYINPKDKCEVGIEIHIGRNRIVRRIFEHLKYQVKALDRVVYAGLTKKNLQRGHWRELTEKEVIFLKHFK